MVKETRKETAYPATSCETTAALNAALEAGDLERIMGIMGEMARAHRMKRGGSGKRPGREKPLQVHAGRGQPRVQHRAPGADRLGLPASGNAHNRQGQ